MIAMPLLTLRPVLLFLKLSCKVLTYDLAYLLTCVPYLLAYLVVQSQYGK